ncbi:MAG: hypothetical protein JJT78_15040 [Leptospira sp.]|nr:hypothetical protein [Leptospira sp.]
MRNSSVHHQFKKFIITSFLSFALGLYFVPVNAVFAQGNAIRKESKIGNAKETYESILSSKWLQEKKDLGKHLAGFEKKSHEYILKLLDDKNYWNRLSGIESAEIESSPDIRKKIFSLYESDHMTRSATQDLITKQFINYERRFLNLLKNTNDEKKRKDLTLLIPMQIPNLTMMQMEEDLNSKNIGIRKVAFQALSLRIKSHPNPEGLDSRLRSYIKDPAMKSTVYKHIQKNGTKNDLDIFLSVLEDPKSEFADNTTALRALKKWGSVEQETKVYQRILSQKPVDEKLAYIAIQIFPDTRSDKIQTQLCQLSKTSSSQDLRLESALALIPYNDKRNIPCFERIAEETLEPSRAPNIVDAAAVVLTFGIAGFHKAKIERNRRSNFETKQSRIKSHLIHLLKE